MTSSNRFADTTVSFQRLVSANIAYVTLMSICAFIVQLCLLHILRYSRTVAVLNATIQEAKGRLLSFGIFCAGFVFAFASLTTAAFGSLMHDYRWFFSAFMRLVIRYMHMDYQETRDATGIVGAFVLLVYCFIMLFVLINIMITLINEALERLRQDESLVPQDHEVIQHMMAKMAMKSEKKRRPRELHSTI